MKHSVSSLIILVAVILVLDRLRASPVHRANLGIDISEDACPGSRPADPSGKGGVWICDPIRIAVMLGECRTYTFGHGNNFEPEEAIHSLNRRCRIHAFDPWVSWAYNAPDYVTLHSAGLGAGYPPMDEWVYQHGDTGREIALLYVDCGGCETRDLPRDIEKCRTRLGTNFTNVVVVVDLSTTHQETWQRGMAEPMKKLGYTAFHRGSLQGRYWVQEVSFALQ